MAKGGARPGAGRPKKVTTYFREHWNDGEREELLRNLKKWAKTDQKVAIWCAEQIYGKAVQSIHSE